MEFCVYWASLWPDASRRNHTQHPVVPQIHPTWTSQLWVQTGAAPPALQSIHGQLSWNLSRQIQHHKPVIGFAEFLLGEVCVLQDYDSEIHWRRPHSTASNENYCYFYFLQASAGGTRMRCARAHKVSTQVHWYLGSLSLLHHFCAPQTSDPHWLLSDKHSTNKL